MKFKCRVLLLVSLLFISRGSIIGYALEPSDRIDTRGLNISWVSGLNNNVRMINFADGVKYFKECKKKVDENSEVKRIVNEYFDEYLADSDSKDKNLLIQTLSGNNFEKFINAGFLWNKNSNLSKYIKGNVDSSFLGVPSNVAKKLKINLKNFFLYSSRELVHRCISSDIKEGEFQTNLAVKQLATYKLAKLFGIDDIVVKTEFVKLITDHGEKLGVLTNQASGVNRLKINEIDLEINTKFQKELTNLQILDTITDEQDHNPGNCFFKISDGQLVGIMAFDNEGGFTLKTNLQRGLCWNAISPTLTKNNKINLPHVSKSLAEKILATEDEDIKKVLVDLLSDKQVSCVIARFNSLKSALINTISKNDDFLLTDEQWCKNTILQENSGNYGKTYLVHFLNNLNVKIK